MIQIYFLTVLFDLLAGIILCTEYIKEKLPSFTGFVELLNGKEVQFIIGLGALICGVFKFITPMGIIIIGDFFPALTSCGLGIILLMDFFKERTSVSSETIERVDSLIENYRGLIGGVGIAMAFIHFIFAGVPAFL
ncbi:MAG: hypothetical protein JXJ04_16465 [Spirochaetales bacterium]|nr:hypothetical protein [Spirochaetales bacterium]